MSKMTQSLAGPLSKMNNLAQSQRRESGDDISEFKPPANDFYNQARQLSIWSKSDVDDMVDGNSSD